LSLLLFVINHGGEIDDEAINFIAKNLSDTGDLYHNGRRENEINDEGEEFLIEIHNATLLERR
jgi:hypothetical protein